MEQVLKQFTIAFGLNNTALKSGLKDSENALNTFANTAKKLLGAWVSFEFFKSAISNFTEYTMQLSNASAITGESAESINALGGALKRFGGNTESAINAIKSINQHLHDAKFGGGALVEVSKKYGVVINKGATAEQTWLNLSKQMAHFDRQTRVAIASQLGLDEAMVRAFEGGGKELEKLINKQRGLNLISPKDETIAKRFSYALMDLKDIFTALMRDFARVILPSFTKLLNIFTSFVEFLRKHKIFVTAFFAGVLLALTPILLTLGKIAVASSLAFAPFYAIGAVIAGLALVFEDLLYYFKGYDSVTEKLVKRFPLLAVLIEPLRPIVLSIYDTFKSIYELITAPSWENLIKVFKNMGGVIKSVIELPLKAIKSIIEGLIQRFPMLETALKPFSVVVNTIRDAFKSISEIIANISFNKLFEGFTELKNNVGGFFDNINPLNLFQSREATPLKIEVPKLEPLKIEPLRLATPVPAQTPLAPFSASVVNHNATTANTTNNTYNTTNNINQNITSATPKQLAENTNRLLIDSINHQRQQQGAF